MCGWVNLRSHLAISFNHNQYKIYVCSLIMTGDLPKWKRGRVVSFLWVTYLGEEWPHYNGWPTQVKKQDGEWSHSNRWPTQKKMMVSLWWVTYPSGKGEEWSHSYGWPTQVKKDGEWSHSNGWPTQKNDGLIMMSDLPRWKMMVSLWWVTYPDVREKDFRKGSQYLETCPFYFFIFIIYIYIYIYIY